jgi:hypothetical protein
MNLETIAQLIKIVLLGTLDIALIAGFVWWEFPELWEWVFGASAAQTDHEYDFEHTKPQAETWKRPKKGVVMNELTLDDRLEIHRYEAFRLVRSVRKRICHDPKGKKLLTRIMRRLKELP